MAKNRTRATTTTNQTQQTVTPGTAYSAGLLPIGTQLGTSVMDQQPYTGDRIAPPSAPQQVAQLGDKPDKFVTSLTATDKPLEAPTTFVAPNYQGAIDTGLAAATSNQAPISSLVSQGFDQWGNILGGQHNPALDAMLSRLLREHTEASARSQNQLAGLMGSQGAYGGTDMGHAAQWLGEQQQQAYDSAVANLLWQDYTQNQNMLLQAPSNIAAFANLSTLPASQMEHFGGLQQGNLMAAAAVGDQNAQALLNNLNQAQKLNDQNAIRAAQDAIAKWQADYQIAQTQAGQANANTAWQQQVAQAGLDNPYLRWVAQNELLNNQVADIGQLISYGGMVPGGTTTMEGRSTTDTQQSQSPLASLGGLLGAGLQLLAPGGPFAGSMKGLFGGAASAADLGGTLGALGTAQPTVDMSWLQPFQWPYQSPYAPGG